jgi:hypothetical protein
MKQSVNVLSLIVRRNNAMAVERIFCLPITIALLLIFTVTVTSVQLHFHKGTNLHFMIFRFWISRTLGHLTYLPPYISDSRSKPPESCIFGQILNITAVLGMIYLRVVDQE